MSNNGWRTVKLGDVCEITSSKRIYASDYTSTGIPFYRGKEIITLSKNEKVKDAIFISQKKYEDLKLKFGAPEIGDILMISIGATLGIPYYLKNDDDFYFKDGNVTWLRNFSTEIHSLFIYQWLRSDYGNKIIWSSIIGAAQPALTIDSIKKFKLKLPSLSVQQNIANLIYNYDNLIQNNIERINSLEESAQRLYQEWFVKFRFPGHENVPMVDSELGPMPEGWRVAKVKDFTDIKSGFAFRGATYIESGEYGIITIKNVHNGYFSPDAANRIKSIPDRMPDHCFLEAGDILLSLTGNVGRTCIVHGKKLLLNQRVAKLAPLPGIPSSFIYAAFRNGRFQKILENLSTGVAQKNLSPVKTKTLNFIGPPRHLIREFGERANCLLQEMLSLNTKQQQLRAARDLLLPKLISGQIDVSELDIATEEMVTA